MTSHGFSEWRCTQVEPYDVTQQASRRLPCGESVFVGVQALTQIFLLINETWDQIGICHMILQILFQNPIQ